jgi:hypothetical protein
LPGACAPPLSFTVRRHKGTTVRALVSCAFAVLITTSAYGVDVPRSYADARGLWEKHMDSAEYKTYVSEFVQFNNHFHIDERNGCYALGKEPIGLMLVITHRGSTEFAVVENVLSDVDSPKGRCFIKSYLGLQTKVPPYVPFILQMAMG